MTNIFDEHLPPIKPADPLDELSGTPRSNKRLQITGLSQQEIKKGTIRLNELSELAFQTLEDAMKNAEYPVAVQAAKLALDRSGFGPTQTIKVDDANEIVDLSNDQLAAIAVSLARKISPGGSPLKSGESRDLPDTDNDKSNVSPSTSIH